MNDILLYFYFHFMFKSVDLTLNELLLQHLFNQLVIIVYNIIDKSSYSNSVKCR